MFCCPGMGRTSFFSYTRFRFSVATSVALVANCFFSLLEACFSLGFDEAFGQAFCTVSTLFPMKEGVFLGASPSRVATDALMRTGGKHLHALHVLHKRQVLLAQRGGTGIGALLRDRRVDRTHHQNVVQRQLTPYGEDDQQHTPWK